ncbi:helix-turn-helix domain-containing protein [Cytophagaceae bacterium DM2B3-1]|uniref:Helix-turn-helix domain-containing protein n=1 Tax=Xanthocytophaga flava TaxID=3048013 RepID=A0ABT7CH14_9BACT|nr:helix-turn-helix domain-containing protein [Xanthocytophaga flavus]MDJ1471034.1 helix-turn-helix domain-containing protein [Xanthocytophaga flavus]MDJ1492983.1 helix-turn-helix domain-containing protein [Xanthocytophaga flavus]
MFLQSVTPLLPLRPFIDSFWVFESDFGVPFTSSRVIVPNGKPKIIIPYLNGLLAQDRSGSQERKEGEIHFVGNWDQSVVISSNTRKTGTIIIELTPAGAYRFAKIAMQEVSNQIIGFSDLYGTLGKNLQEQIGNIDYLSEKIRKIQQFLLSQLLVLNQHQGIVDFVTNSIYKSQGRIEIKELEQKTGYSKRYLSLLFNEYIGISPKTLAAIVRFQRFYHLWANAPSPSFYKDDLYQFYYDQSHFIKEFKRFTGYSPVRYAETDNEFGRIFYKE